MTDFSTIKQETVIDKPKDNLNPKFFIGNKLNRRLRKVMLNLFNMLIDDMPLKKVNQFIVEKNFVGSMASYQWATKSDIDLHLVINDDEMAAEYNTSPIEILETLRKTAKHLNKKFFILGHPVEFYIQGQNEPFYSDGIYDIEYDTWTKNPEIKAFDKEKVKEAKQQAKEYKKYIFDKMKSINIDLKNSKKKQINDKNIDKLKNDLFFIESEIDKLKNDRNKSIRKEGNDSIGNMRFKFIQRLKIIEKMKDKRESIIEILLNYL